LTKYHFCGIFIFMSESGERSITPSAPVAEFGAYIVGRIQQLETLHSFFLEALPVVTDLEGVNKRLAETGRPDLAVVERADMLAISTPQEIPQRGNNFLPNFHFWTGKAEVGDPDPWGNRPKENIPATLEEVLALRQLPRLNSFEEKKEAANQFPALKHSCHGTRPAFTRMLILFPEFTTSLVTEMSAPANRSKYDKFEERLFVAYQLMSRLVDKADYGVVNEQGEVDSWYLCH
jgi:hypothetical protein